MCLGQGQDRDQGRDQGQKQGWSRDTHTAVHQEAQHGSVVDLVQPCACNREPGSMCTRRDRADVLHSGKVPRSYVRVEIGRQLGSGTGSRGHLPLRREDQHLSPVPLLLQVLPSGSRSSRAVRRALERGCHRLRITQRLGCGQLSVRPVLCHLLSELLLLLPQEGQALLRALLLLRDEPREQLALLRGAERRAARSSARARGEGEGELMGRRHRRSVADR